jgi:hypothetical protein
MKMKVDRSGAAARLNKISTAEERIASSIAEDRQTAVPTGLMCRRMLSVAHVAAVHPTGLPACRHGHTREEFDSLVEAAADWRSKGDGYAGQHLRGSTPEPSTKRGFNHRNSSCFTVSQPVGSGPRPGSSK